MEVKTLNFVFLCFQSAHNNTKECGWVSTIKREWLLYKILSPFHGSVIFIVSIYFKLHNFLLFRELETAFEEERDTCKAEKSKVASLEESVSTERKKLQEEIDEKLKIITDLSKQLEVHQKNFDALKSELGQVKRTYL